MRPAAGSTPAPLEISPPAGSGASSAGGGLRRVAPDGKADLVLVRQPIPLFRMAAGRSAEQPSVYSETGAGVRPCSWTAAWSSRAAAITMVERGEHLTPRPEEDAPSGKHRARGVGARVAGRLAPFVAGACRAADRHAPAFEPYAAPARRDPASTGSRRPTARGGVTSWRRREDVTLQRRRRNEVRDLVGAERLRKSTLLRPRGRADAGHAGAIRVARQTALREPFPDVASCIHRSPCSCWRSVLDTCSSLSVECSGSRAPSTRKQAADLLELRGSVGLRDQVSAPELSGACSSVVAICARCCRIRACPDGRAVRRAGRDDAREMSLELAPRLGGAAQDDPFVTHSFPGIRSPTACRDEGAPAAASPACSRSTCPARARWSSSSIRGSRRRSDDGTQASSFARRVPVP